MLCARFSRTHHRAIAMACTAPETSSASYFSGRRASLPPDGAVSGIAKSPITGPTAVDCDGLRGDEQADRRVHGGAEKAMHHFPRSHYARLAARFPAAAALLAPGSIGENISAAEWTEHDVHIGDVFAAGTVRLQISQPRRPCWKIDARFGVRDMAAWIQQQGIPGWYCRVLTAGTLRPDTPLVRLESRDDTPSLAEFLALTRAQRPPPGALARLAALEGLAVAWVERLNARIAWLERYAPQHARQGELGL